VHESFPLEICEDKLDSEVDGLEPEEVFLLVSGFEEAEGKGSECDFGSDGVFEADFEVLADSLGVFLHVGEVVVDETRRFLFFGHLVDVVVNMQIYHPNVCYHSFDFEERVFVCL